MTSRGRLFATSVAALIVMAMGGGSLTACSSRPKRDAVSSVKPDTAYADYWTARDAVFRACMDGEAAACLRAAFGPYLLSDVDRWEVSRKGCELGEALACESGCVSEIEELGDKIMETMPAMQTLGDATARTFRDTCRRSWSIKSTEWSARVAEACAGDRESPQCLATRALSGASTEDSKAPSAPTAMETPGLLRERNVTMCASGYRPACLRLAVSEQPLDAAPACLAGERITCSSLASSLLDEPLRRAKEIPEYSNLFVEDVYREQREEAARQVEDASRKVLDLLLQQCASVPWACPAAIEPVNAPWYERFLLVEGPPATCHQAIARARNLAKLPPLLPGRELDWALAGCAQMREPHRTCLADADDPSDLFNCARASRPEEVLAAEARRLAREAIQYFHSNQRVPAAWPKTELLPACCGVACAPPAPEIPSAIPIYDDDGEMIGVENGDAEGQAYRDIEEEEEALGTYRYKDDDDNYFESELRTSSPKDSVDHNERYFWAHLMLERQGDVVIASARGRRTCDEPEVIVEERWQLINGAPSRVKQTKRTAPQR